MGWIATPGCAGLAMTVANGSSAVPLGKFFILPRAGRIFLLAIYYNSSFFYYIDHK